MGHIKQDKPGRLTHTYTNIQTHRHIDLRMNVTQQKNNPNGFPVGIEVS